jgi:hypothetical protein
MKGGGNNGEKDACGTKRTGVNKRKGKKKGAGESPWKGVFVQNTGSLPSIKEKFDIQLDGAAGVTAVFQELSAFIKKDGLGVNFNVIHLGDYIDLEGGLEVSWYSASTCKELTNI